MFNINNRAGQVFTTHKRRVMNRTAATVAIGDVVAFDMLATDADITKGVGGGTGLDKQDGIFHNVVAVAAGNKDGLIAVVSGLLSGAGKDNTEIEVTLLGQRVKCKVNSTTDIAIGDRLKPVAADDHLVKLAAAAADERAVAYALEARTTDDEGTIDVTFFGGVPFAGALGS